MFPIYNTVNVYGKLVHVPKLPVNVFPNPNIELSQQNQSNDDYYNQNERDAVCKVDDCVMSTCLDLGRRKKIPRGSSGDLWLGRSRSPD